MTGKTEKGVEFEPERFACLACLPETNPSEMKGNTGKN